MCLVTARQNCWEPNSFYLPLDELTEGEAVGSH